MHQCNSGGHEQQPYAQADQDSPHHPSLHVDQQVLSPACENTPPLSPPHQQLHDAIESEQLVEDTQALQEGEEEEIPEEDEDLEWDSDESDGDSDPDLREASSSSTTPHQKGETPRGSSSTMNTSNHSRNVQLDMVLRG